MRKTILWLATLAWAILIFHLTSIPNFKVSDNTLTSLLISSGAHFIFFGIQGALFYLSLSSQVVPALALTSLYGLFDELHQRGIPGRSANPADWILDTVGALVFIQLVRKYTQKAL